MSEEVLDHCAGHNLDPAEESVCVQNVETENRNPKNNNGEILDLEPEPKFGNTVEGFPTDQKDDKTEDIRPMKSLKCEGTESGNMVFDTGTKEKDPFMDNEEYKRDKWAAFDHKDLEYMTDHTNGTCKRVGTKQNAGSGSAIDSVSSEVQENFSSCSMEAEGNKNSNTDKAIQTGVGTEYFNEKHS